MKQKKMALVALMTLMLAVMLLPQSSLAADGSATRRRCVLACSQRLRQCSMYSVKEVPRGYRRVSHLPFGYKRVYGNSVCERLVCAKNSVTCRPWVPTGRGT